MSNIFVMDYCSNLLSTYCFFVKVIFFRRILNDQPIAKRMILILKHWLKLIKVSMNGYAIAYLVIFYLQLQKLIVPVWHMTTGSSHEKKIICGKCIFKLYCKFSYRYMSCLCVIIGKGRAQ